MTAETQQQGAPMDDLAERVADTVIDTVDRMLREHGLVLPPTVHLFVDELAMPYAGYVISREFYQGADAFDAVAGLGALTASMVADRALVCWENADLCTAMWGPGEYAQAQMILDAHIDGRAALHRHPFDLTPGPPNGDGFLTGVPAWRRPQRVEPAPLPAPVEELVRVWFTDAPDHEFGATVERMQAEGYRINFTF